jgi:hypothetical protein
MKTIMQKIDATNMASSDFKEAAELLRAGKLVAFPTETVYGLGGNAYDSTASARIYAAKGRPSDNPLIVHISCFDELPPLVSVIPDEAKALADRFWPGPHSSGDPVSFFIRIAGQAAFADCRAVRGAEMGLTAPLASRLERQFVLGFR